MADVLQGAYVQAWVWVPVDYDDPLDLNEGPLPTDRDFREWARQIYASEGSIEFDDNPVVSRSKMPEFNEED